MKKTYEQILQEEASYIFDELDTVDFQFQEGHITAAEAITRLQELVNSAELEEALDNYEASKMV